MYRILLLTAFFLCSCNHKDYKSQGMQVKKCAIDTVIFYGVGCKNTLQFSPIWEAHTDCGIIPFNKEVSSKDTILILFKP